LHSIHIVVGIMSNVDDLGAWVVHRLHSNTMSLYIRGLNIRGFWYLWGVLEPIPQAYWVRKGLGASDSG
jgi:hypothetical protein